MKDSVDKELLDLLRGMSPEEQVVFLRTLLRLRVHCPRCLLKFPRLGREPCYSCTVLPDDRGLCSLSAN